VSEAAAETRGAAPFVLEIPTRWNDNDIYGHVNNVEYLAFFDTVINTYLITQGGLDIERGPVIGLCAESHCTYRAAFSFPETVHAHLRVGQLGRTSVRYEIDLHRADDSEPAATGYFVHVFVDRADRRPIEIPGPLRGALQALITSSGGPPH
jgi:acyl-CoA thioester hydrolase